MEDLSLIAQWEEAGEQWQMFSGAPVLLGMIVVASCATTVPLASPESDAAANKFEPPEGKSNLYIARSTHSSGAAVAFKVSVDGEGVGSIGPGTFCLVTLGPGVHVVSVSMPARTTSTR